MNAYPRTHNPSVVGSNPTGPTKSFESLGAQFALASKFLLVRLVATGPGISSNCGRQARSPHRRLAEPQRVLQRKDYLGAHQRPWNKLFRTRNRPPNLDRDPLAGEDLPRLTTALGMEVQMRLARIAGVADLPQNASLIHPHVRRNCDAALLRMRK